MGLAERYCDGIRDELEFYAAWLPDTIMRLGDYGKVDDGVFQRAGNIRELGVAFPSILGEPGGDHEYQSDGTTVTNINAGTQGLVNAGMKFTFTSKHSTYFLASDCERSSMSDIPSVVQQIIQKFRERSFDLEDYHLVVNVLKANSFSLITSTNKNAEFLIEAKNTQVPNLDLKIPNFSFETRRVKNVGYKFIAKPGLTPLIGLVKLDD
jgi:hypothetical protein